MKVISLLVAFVAMPMMAHAQSDAQNWITETSGQPGEWVNFGTMTLPSGVIFIGDPSWGDDYHMRGARGVPARRLDVFLHINVGENQVNAAWLEAGGGVPVRQVGMLEFGMDSAYFAFGDRRAGEALLDLPALGIEGAYDSHEFMFQYIGAADFMADWVQVPPDDMPVMIVTTRFDGGLGAAWALDDAGQFSGILIDITGRTSDGVHLDTLLLNDSAGGS